MKKYSHTLKRMLSAVIVYAMIFSMLPLGISAADDQILYLKPNSNWTQSGARFAIYYWNGTGSAWADMSDPDGDGTYEGAIPAGYTNIIFCRMNPSTTANNWDNKWNQTGDLTVPTDGNNCCAINAGQWDCGTNVTWSHIHVYSSVVTPPTCTEGGYTTNTCSCGDSNISNETAAAGHAWSDGVCGTCSAVCEHESYTSGVCDECGAAEPVTDTVLYLLPGDAWKSDNARFAVYYWNGTGSAWASLTDTDGDGYYEVTLPDGYTNVIFCRMNPNASANNWDNKWNQTSDLSYDGTNNCFVIDDPWNSGDTGYWTTYTPVQSEPEPTQTNYYLVGWINNADYNGEEYQFVDGELTVTFASDSYVVVKDGSGDWYLCETYCTGTSATLTKGHSEKMFVPANTELTFTLEENDDGTLTLAYTTTASGGAGGDSSDPQEDCTVTLHFANTQNWGAVALYIWDGNGSTLLGSWPGTQLTKGDDGFYTHSLDVPYGTTVNFIFNNNGGGNQTADLTLGTVTADTERWIKGEQILTESFRVISSPVVEGSSVTFYYENASASDVSVAFGGNTYPMEQDADGIWTVTVSELQPGNYDYQFSVDGSTVSDPLNASGSFVIMDPNAEDENKITLNIHYTRADGNYDGWNFHIWNADGDIEDTSVLTDEGLVATLVFEDARSVLNVSLIPRYSTADNKWAAQEATHTIDLSNVLSGTVDYYITSGSSSGSKVLGTNVVTGIKLSSVELDYDTGKIDVNVAQKVENPEFGITDDADPTTYTIYFQNNWLWDDVCVYYWGSEGTNPGWPGEAMTKVGTYGGNDLYSVDIPTDVTGMIINGIKNDGSGNRDQTPDITSGFIDGICYKMSWNNGNVAESFVYDAPITITETIGSGAEYTLTVSEELDLVTLYQHKIVFEGYEYDIDINSVYASDRFAAEYTYEGEDLGAYWMDSCTTFRVWAPTAEAVKVALYATGSDAEEGAQKLGIHSLERDVNGTWVGTVEGDLNGVYYTYAVTVNGETVEAVDPYARTTGVNGQRGMVIDLDSTDPDGWDMDTNPNPIESYTDAIIYELHVRDFSIDSSSGILEDYQGKFLAFTQTGTTVNGEDNGLSTGIDYLKQLGVTHVHLLPVYDYGSVDETTCSNFNWGYDPVNYNVPEGSYSTDPYKGEVRVEEFKKMVLALHEAGISVIMDVVYNHVYDAGEFCFNQIVPGYFSRVNSNTSGCGNDTASEREMVRKYIVESVVYWCEEYHIDGFRFDLVGLIDVDTINALVKAVHDIRPDVIFYGEGWNMDGTNKEEGTEMAKQGNADKTPGFAYFSDSIRNQIAGSNGSSLGFVSGGGAGNLINYILAKPESWGETWTDDPEQVVQYASCHDNYTLIDKLIISTGAIGVTDKIIKMNNLSAAIYMTSQGIPFIHAGEEMLREKLEEDGGRCENSYNATDYVNSIKWDNLLEEEYTDTLAYYQGLIAFRKAHAALRMDDGAKVAQYVQAISPMNNVIAFFIDGSGCGDDDIVIIFNANETPAVVDIPEGVWNVCVDNEDAGTDTLYTAQTKVQLSGISAMILTKADAGEDDSQIGSGSSASDTITLYFSNNKYWDKVYAYYWGGSSGPNWPGELMTWVEKNGYGEDIYSITIPADSTGIIFNNGSEQTVDLKPGVDGTGYYCESNSSSSWTCGTYEYAPSGGSGAGFANDGVYEGEKQYYLFGWINSEDYGSADYSEAMGKYQFVDGKLTVTFELDSYVGVKTTANETWYMTKNWLGNVTSTTLYDSETLGTAANKLIVPGGVEVTFTLVENDDGTLTLSYEAEKRAVEDTSGIQNGTTLHCWNWSFDQIAENMALIAEMGFTAIQTSPIQPLKEATTDATDIVGGCWWVYYQPVGFTITDDDGNVLGTREDLLNMIQVAHEYGIQVIVDVVVNHLGNQNGNDLSDQIPEDLQNDRYWHDIHTNTSDYTDRYDVTQHCMSGLPDLNTGDADLQKLVLGFLNDCIDAGVDGFRFDAAKHIETPDDELPYDSDFWPVVVGGAEQYAQQTYGKDIYIYGEVLDGMEGIPVASYTEFMAVTDNSWGNTLRGQLANGNAAISQGYDKATDASNLVIWAESHDTYATDQAALSSAGVNMKVINKTWALVAARADAMGLYLARPESMDQALGVASVTGWYSNVVRTANAFHNAFVGQSETVGNEGAFAYVVRGTTGIVIVNAQGNAADVELTVQMDDGTYIDQLSGKTFTVSGGKLTGRIGSAGVAVVYNTKMNVTVIEPENGEITVSNAEPITGETVTVEVIPETGKQIAELVILDEAENPVAFTDNGDGTYSFTQPPQNVTVSVVLEDILYRVDVSESEDGQASVSNENPIYGEEVTITVTPNVGKKVSSVNVTIASVGGIALFTNVDVTDNGDGTYTFLQPDGNVTVEVTYENIVYHADVEDVTGGTVTVDPSEPVYQEQVTVTVTPDEGMEVVSVTVSANGEALDVTDNGDGTYTYTQPAEDVTVLATFQAIEEEPTDPTDPSEPEEEPTDPTVPTEPEEEPTDPTDPSEPEEEPTDPTVPTEPEEEEPTDPTVPTEPEEEPTDPTVPTEPEEDPTDPTVPTEPEEEPTDPTDPSEPEEDEPTTAPSEPEEDEPTTAPSEPEEDEPTTAPSEETEPETPPTGDRTHAELLLVTMLAALAMVLLLIDKLRKQMRQA